MRIAIGCDDTGFPLKEQVSAALEASGHDLLDLGRGITAAPFGQPRIVRPELERYAPQLASYGAALPGSRQGLYFALLRGWREASA